MMPMRFTILTPSRRHDPNFTARRQKKKFLIFAVSEISTLVLLALLLFHFRSLSDPALIASAIIVAFGAVSILIRKSATYAQFIFMLSLLAIELIVLSDVAPFTIELLTIPVSSAALFPALFIPLDIVVIWWVIARGIFIDVDEELRDE